jgi:membrane-bound lytic murein transglycosylase D
MKLKFIIILVLSLLTCLSFGAATVVDTIGEIHLETTLLSDTIETSDTLGFDENLDDVFEPIIDSMENSWFVQNVFVPDSMEVDFKKSAGNMLPDSIYISRLQDIKQEVELSFNETVKNFIELYTVRKREQMEIMLGLSEHYFPVFEESLDKYNLPFELKYLTIIESALNPQARSRVGATGLWQFMLGTAKILNLEVTTFIDERKDPIKSTDAAARYLKQLYEIYHDWFLVIAAYNCGPGNVNKAINRSGGKMDYWSIYYRLPRETRGYVPAFIAATYVMNFFNEHRLIPRVPEFPIETDTIVVNNYLHFNQISEKLGMDIKELRDLNPMYRRDVIPGKPEKSYVLRLPVERITDFVQNEDSIFNYKRDKYFPNNTLATPAQLTASSFTPGDIAGKAKIYYTVQSGDNLGFISDWFNVRTADLRYWNDINRNFIKTGQKLVIYVPEGQKAKYEAIAKMNFSEKQGTPGKTATASSPTSTTLAKTTATKATSGSVIEYEYHTVRKGDNPWSIAKKYVGVSSDDILKLNNIKDPSDLVVGQKLKIRPKV